MCYNKLMVKKGDTLIEVVLAVGIFSMIAVAVVAVMSGGTSSAQVALETTLAREEIDSQAEALRFIHTSYIAEKDSASQKYQSIWQDIIDSAIKTTPTDDFLQFAPDACKNIYSSDEFKNHAFIINYRSLGNYINGTTTTSPFVSAEKSPSSFIQASAYPRLVYSSEATSNLSNNSFAYTTLSSVEGIYVTAVKDAGETNIVNKEGMTSAFYDFYIRTCWYGTNANEPSTISTVIRLYDPKAVE